MTKTTSKKSKGNMNNEDPDMPNTQARMGRPVPNFKAMTTEGEIDFHEWLGNSWGLLFSHPAPFTPICTTEVGSLAKSFKEFEKRNVKLLGVSCEDVSLLHGWIDDIKAHYKMDNFPITLLADEDRKVAFKYGLIEPTYRDTFSGIAYPCRGLFLIAPDKILKLMCFHPWSLGRSTEEIIRSIDSLQLTREFNEKVCTPADWTTKNPVMIDTSTSLEDINNMFKKGVVTHFLPSGKEYLRTVGGLSPTHSRGTPSPPNEVVMKENEGPLREKSTNGAKPKEIVKKRGTQRKI